MTPPILLDTLIITAIGFIMVVGLLGAVVPILPGLVLIWVAGWAYGALTHFGIAGWIIMILMTILMIVGYVGSLLLPQVGGVARGASLAGIALSLILGIIGFFVIPVIGLPIGATLGIYIVEYIREEGDKKKAWDTTKGVLLGFGVGVAVELGSGFLMMGLWLIWVIINLTTGGGAV